MIKLIIFDLDGTLADSAADIAVALNYSLAPFGLEKISVERTVGLIGEGTTRLIEKVTGGRKEIMEEVLKRFLEYYSEHLCVFTKAYPGVRAVLLKLSGYRKAVISNKREQLSKRLLERLGLLSYFDLVLGSDSVEERKPSPKPVFRALDFFSARAGEAVIVGDSAYDIEAAKAAGVKSIAVTYGYGDGLSLDKADLKIGSIEELLPAIGRLDPAAGGKSAT